MNKSTQRILALMLALLCILGAWCVIGSRRAAETPTADPSAVTDQELAVLEDANRAEDSSVSDFVEEEQTEEAFADLENPQAVPPMEDAAEVLPETETQDLTCTLSVRCDTVLANLDLLAVGKEEILPSDGVILAETTVAFTEGESVFQLLEREMKAHQIPMEFVNPPLYQSAYIEGIANLYEFDCGELSGWMYRVNGWFPNYGCSRYRLKDGDKVEWVYTCDLGADVGGNGGQNDA